MLTCTASLLGLYIVSIILGSDVALTGVSYHDLELLVCQSCFVSTAQVPDTNDSGSATCCGLQLGVIKSAEGEALLKLSRFGKANKASVCLCAHHLQLAGAHRSCWRAQACRQSQALSH